jgi:hypothetical protein
MATNPGDIVASNMPRRKRTVARPAKEEQVAVSMRMEAHVMMLTVYVTFNSMMGRGGEQDALPRNFAMGKR